MTLIRYRRPESVLWRPFADLQTEIHRLFGDVCREEAPESGAFVPAVDVLEKEDKVIVKADLPGVAKEDVQVTVHEGLLTLRGKREHGEETTEEGVTHIERSVGSFARSLQLPAEVDGAKVSATYRDGVLTIEAPKHEEAKPRTIDVSVN